MLLPDIDPSPQIVTFGETLLRHTASGGARLERARNLELTVGGAESNVATAAAALGCRGVWLSKLPDSRLADHVLADLRSRGVEPVVARGDGRVGCYYVEAAGEPRGWQVEYDRAATSIRTARPDELALDRVRAADVFYTSGITPALSSTLAETSERLLEIARGAGVKTAVDVNYRSKLWDPTDASQALAPILERADTIVVASRDAAALYDLDGPPSETAQAIRERFGPACVIVTDGEAGATVWRDGETVTSPSVPTDTLDPIGSGDAFVGGFLAADQLGHSLETALRVASFLAAWCRTLPGDAIEIDREEIRAGLEPSADGSVGR